MSDTVLVIGGTGNTGRSVIETLAAKGRPVRALVRDAAKLGELPATPVEGDLDNPESLARAMAGVAALFVTTPVSESTVPRFRNVFDAARAAGVGHVVKLSAQGAAADADAAILRQHAEADRLLADSGLNYTILRPSVFFQNLLSQAHVIAATGGFYLPVGDASVAMLDARDIGEAAANIIVGGGHAGATYTLTGPEPIDYATVAERLGSVIGKSVTYTPVPVAATEQALIEAGLPAWDAAAIAEIQGAFASGDFATPTDDLERLLGRAPRPFDAFARDFRGAFAPGA